MLRHYISLISLSVAALLLVSCASRRTAATLDDVETYIQQRPDSALAAIRAIDTTTLTSRGLRAHYALLHAMALDKNWIDTTDVGVVMPAVEYYDRHPSDICRAKAWYYLGRIQQNAGDRPEAIISFMKAERYAEASKDVDFKGLICLAISTIYSQTHLHDEALEYTERAYSLFVEAKDTSNANSALLCMANDYYNLERYSEADSLYRDLIKNGDVYSNLRSSLQCGYALSLVKPKEDYEQAVRVFEEVITSTGRLRNRNTWGAYAYSLLRVGREKQAEQIFKQLEAKQGDAFLSYSYWKSLADAYVGDFASAYRLQNKAYEIQNENVVIALKQSTIKAQKDFLEEVTRESETAARRKLVNHWLIWGFVVLLLLTAAIVANLHIKRKHEQDREKSLELEQENAFLQEAVTALSDKVTEMNVQQAQLQREYTLHLQSSFREWGQLYKAYYHPGKNDILDIRENVYYEATNAISRLSGDKEGQMLLERRLNELFDDVMVHYRADFPDEAESDYHFVSFVFAGFDASILKAAFQIPSIPATYARKSRLKESIQNSSSRNKEQYLRFFR
ncbi:MAG: hypothetical protein IKQ01_08640 [Bacteroidales bacterium]|nr:hypothetical protein [Bacteroidales bacterium]